MAGNGKYEEIDRLDNWIDKELVQDIISILHAFSCRLYGLRKYKKQIKEDDEIAKELQEIFTKQSG